MDGMHCRYCRCTQMQDKPRLPMTDEGVLGTESLIASGLESSSLPHHLTNRHWFGRASRLEVSDADLNHSFDLGNSRFLPDTLSISSTGNLVCSTSAVSASQPSKLPEIEYSWNDALSRIGLHSSANQAPRRDGEVKDISQGLEFINRWSTQPSVITRSFEPRSLQLVNVVPGQPLVSNQAHLNSDCPILLHPTHDLLDHVSESVELPSDEDFFKEFLDVEVTASCSNVPLMSCQQSPFLAVSNSQSDAGLLSLPLSAGRSFSPTRTVNSSNWYNTGPILSEPLLTPTPPREEQSCAVMPAILCSSSQDKCKTKMISVYCCPHHDCDYTAKIWRDVERHLGSKKHGGSSSRFPCTIEGCNTLKDNTRRDNLRRHMKTVHGVIMPQMRKGRREKRYRVQSQAQQ